jgi:aminoglycoside phosphotransferase (APT) family kinase protein
VSPVDIRKLGRWLDDQGVPGGEGAPAVEKMAGGSQNILYRIRRGQHSGVLRMPGPNADDARIDGLRREIRLLAALAGADVPHAELLAAEPTGDLLGRPFYVMQDVDGWSPLDGWRPPYDDDLEARRELAFGLVDGAARLARLDWRACGLDGFGRPDGFHDRQVDRWLGFYRAFEVRDLPGLDDAAEWLRRNKPDHYMAGIMHGDYHFANVMFRHGPSGNLAAIVDWEMTTVGDPLLDLAWAVIGWEDGMPLTEMGIDLRGMPHYTELFAHYERVSGLSTEHIDYYRVLANWKFGIILEKSYAAQVRGKQVDDKVALFGPAVPRFISAAAELADSLAARSS